jgi:hypothetical protein
MVGHVLTKSGFIVFSQLRLFPLLEQLSPPVALNISRYQAILDHNEVACILWVSDR